MRQFVRHIGLLDELLEDDLIGHGAHAQSSRARTS